jgi:L-rhamnose mutarotase
MERIAFKMRLLPSKEEEYKKRKRHIWPALVFPLKNTGINDYSIYHDLANNDLRGVLKTRDPAGMASLPAAEIMQGWWKYMSDIMETNADNSPAQLPLQKVFYLP